MTNTKGEKERMAHTATVSLPSAYGHCTADQHGWTGAPIYIPLMTWNATTSAGLGALVRDWLGAQLFTSQRGKGRFSPREVVWGVCAAVSA